MNTTTLRSRMSPGRTKDETEEVLTLPLWRSRVVLWILLFGFLGLILRAVWLQVVQRDLLRGESNARIAREIELPAFRGRILDRNGEVLAVSTPSASIFAFTSKAELSPAQLTALSKALDMSAAQINKRLQVEDEVVMLKRQVSANISDQIAKMKIPGIGVQHEYKREYPGGEALSQVLGMTNVDERGQEGMELSQNGWLAGKNGKRKVLVNRRGEVVEDVSGVLPPKEGRDITLSIDHRLQFLAYQALSDAVLEHKAKAGSAVVIDVRTGEILALANYPSFDPNKRETYTKDKARNRALTDTFEPGSTMKPFTTAVALERGIVRPDTIIATGPGVYSVNHVTIRDTSDHGNITVEEVVAMSSNIGTAKISAKLSSEALHKAFSSAGFGTAPQTGFPGEVGGRLRNPKTWQEVEKMTMSYGYGLSVNLVQLARAYTVFASEGERKAATLMRTGSAVAGEPVFSEKTVLSIRKMLEMAVEGEHGTGKFARIKGYRVGGKTGTAKKSISGRYADGKYVGSFVGIAPISHPRIVAAVMIDEPNPGPHKYYGGVVAAPAFSRIAKEALRILDVPFDAPATLDIPRPALDPDSLPKEEV